MVVFSQDAHLLKLLLSDRGPEGVATWARDADLKLGLGLQTSLMSFEETPPKKTCNKKITKVGIRSLLRNEEDGKGMLTRLVLQIIYLS